MSVRRLHRRLAVLMGLAGLTAFAGGAGFEPVSALPAAAALTAALFWQPSPRLSSRLERIWVPLAAILVVRALYHVIVVGDDVVVPVVDLLLLLLAAESLRSLDTPNDPRIYALSFALLLASAAYRPGALFAVAFVAFLVLGTLALFVGHVRREAERHDAPEPLLRRPLLTRMAALSGVVLATAVVVFLTFPRVSRGWTTQGEAASESLVGFSDVVSIGEFGATIRPNPRVVLRVEFPDDEPPDPSELYWRGRSYDRFDGIRWTRSSDLPPSLAPEAWYRQRWGAERVTQEIYAEPLQNRVLFALHPVVDVDARSPVRGLFDNAGDFAYRGSAGPVYRAVSVTSRPSPDDLRSAEGRSAPARGHYTQLPDLPDRIGALADSLAGDRETRYDRVVAVRDWLESEFGYTLQLPRTAGRATLDHFLFERREGHCEYFSTAMVVLLRSLGIPARNVNGFLGGSWSEFGQYMAVTQNEAHSWVEVWFPDYGWVPFDPTPSGSGGGEAQTVGFWPGRFLLDGIQHRWSKWVLDYSIDTQWNLLEQMSTLVAGADDAPSTSGGSSGSSDIPGGLWLGLAAAALAAGAAVVARRREAVRPESRPYLRLRRYAARSGLEGAEGSAPLALVRRLRHREHPAAAAAEELVADYLRVRFGGEPLDEGRRERMDHALSRAKKAFRSAPDTAGHRSGGESPDRSGCATRG